MVHSSPVSIDGDRLLADLRELRTFGASGGGVVRTTFSDADMAARRWLRDRMADAGLDATIDGVGNVLGRSPNPGPALLVGSHSDTQPSGGWLDGAMGVVHAIEVARSLLADPTTADLAVDVVAWSDEEGTFASFLGSRSYVGELADDDLDGPARSAIERVGLAGTPRARLDPARTIAYVESHIEQGPHLDDAGLRIGVVTSIVGIRALTVCFEGEQNHAGTTPMTRRRDAAVAMFEFGSRLQEVVARVAGPATVWTVGRVTVEPGAQSIVPGRAEVVVQLRDPDPGRLDGAEHAVVGLAAELDAAGPCRVAISRHHEPVSPAAMDPAVRAALAAAAEARVPGGWQEMPSAAAHDAQVLAPHLPCGMLFVPSIGGISHDPAEDSHEDDIVLGGQVLADAAVGLLLRRG